jgi:protein involved in polysaccharide export with SLBB domain
LIDRIRAAGLTVQQLAADVTNRLREFLLSQRYSSTLLNFGGAPVFFVGMFQRPGIVTLQGRRTLLEMLAYMGGLQPNASRRIRIRRRLEYGPIPLPNAVEDSEKKTSTVEISFASIVLRPNDVVTVDRAEPVYVAGQVTRPGPIDLGARLLDRNPGADDVRRLYAGC